MTKNPAEFDDIMDLMIPCETVNFGEKSYQVRGLALPHIIFIVRNHHATLETLYQKAMSGQLEADVQVIAAQLADEFTPVAAAVIACGMGKPEAAAKVALMPFLFQCDALDKIIRLTLAGEGGVEKLMEIVTRVLGATASLTSRKTLTTG